MYKQLGYQLGKIALRKNPTSIIKYATDYNSDEYLKYEKRLEELRKKLEQKAQQTVPKQEIPEKSPTELGKELGQKVGRKERFKTWLKQQSNWLVEKGKKTGNFLKNLLSRKPQEATQEATQKATQETVAATGKGLTDFIREHPKLSVGLAAGIPTAAFLIPELFSSDHNQKNDIK
jgi:ElaB/YqjD/DUF883 family membrane-anchored ribosome-binding protein